MPDGEENRRSIEFVVDHNALEALWKKSIRGRLRQTRFPDFIVGHDAAEWAAVDWEIREIIGGLRRAVLDESYRPKPPEVLRGAKSRGLTRSLASLQVEDALLFKALVAATAGRLQSLSHPWTGSGREEAKAPTESKDSYPATSWFLKWLKTDEYRWKLITTSAVVVESDIASFFPTIDIPTLRNLLAVHSRLDLKAVNLLVTLLLGICPRPGFNTDVQRGIPIEDHDCSRTLAHFFLQGLDNEFLTEGQDGKYTRFVDDIAVGASSDIEAARIAGRVQKALEAMQLTLNTSKTQFFTVKEFQIEYCMEQNDFLGAFEPVGGKPMVDPDIERLESFLTSLLTMPKRTRGWTRVLRRYCTIARRLRSASLLPLVPELVFREPNAARHLLEYRASFPITGDDIAVFATALQEWGDLYDEVDCLVLEMLNIAPNDDSAGLRQNMGVLCETLTLEHFQTRPRVAASSLIGLGKFAAVEQVAGVGEKLRGAIQSDSAARQQLALLMRGLGVWTNEEATALLRDPSIESARHLRLMSAVEQGDESAFGAVIQVLRPSSKKDPDRLVLRPRSLFLAKAVQKGQPKKWMAASTGWKKSLLALPDEFQDRAAMRVLDWHY